MSAKRTIIETSLVGLYFGITLDLILLAPNPLRSAQPRFFETTSTLLKAGLILGCFLAIADKFSNRLNEFLDKSEDSSNSEQQTPQLSI